MCKRFEQLLHQKNILKTAKKHMKRCSLTLVLIWKSKLTPGQDNDYVGSTGGT